MELEKRIIHFVHLITHLKSEKKLEDFEKLRSNAARIKFLLPVLDKILTDMDDDDDEEPSKHLIAAELLKRRGNAFFANGLNSKAIEVYNDAIQICPQHDSLSKTLYAILIANRSAAFFDSGDYEKVLNDIEFLKHFGHHPNPNKLKQREFQSIKALGKSKAIKPLDAETRLQEEFDATQRNEIYPALSNKLTVMKNATMGRHIVATQDIKTGEIIAMEKPYVIVCKHEEMCAHCMKSTDQFYACAECPIVFCSLQCLEKAKTYHQYECKILDFLRENQDFWIIIRMISQRPLQQVIADEAAAKVNRPAGDIEYRSDDYYNIYRLHRNEDCANVRDLLRKIFFGTLLLRALRRTNYFGNGGSNSGSLSKNEVFIGELLVRYYEIGQSNAHSVYGIFNNKRYAKAGAGIYSTLSLFNHSCAPQIEKFNVNDMMVIRTIQPIKAGDIVYDNYGPVYFVNEKEERNVLLTQNYKFTCDCQACKEDWPVSMELDPNKIHALCDCGGAIPIGRKMTKGVCKKCRKTSSLHRVRRVLIEIDRKMTEADGVFSSQNFAEAQKLYCEVIDLQYKHLAQPIKSTIFMQDRLIDLFRFNGNNITSPSLSNSIDFDIAMFAHFHFLAQMMRRVRVY